MFSHDDIEILTPDFAARLKVHLSQHDVVGACGAARLVLGHWMSAGWPHLRGLVAHQFPAGHRHAGWYRVLVLDDREEDASGLLQVLDGMFIAVNRRVLERVRFDERFDGFHMYDLDFSFAAYQAGFDVAVFRDISMIHYTSGDSPGYEEAYTRYRLQFEEKYRNELPPAAERRPFPFAAMTALFRDKAQVDAFCRELRAFRSSVAAPAAR